MKTVKQIHNLYLEYINDYLTIAKFAEHKGISEQFAKSLIEEGKAINLCKFRRLDAQ